MRSQVIFSDNDLVAQIYSEFQISNGPLFHYTSPEKIESIKKGTELWLTRADSFLDSNEIKYGIELFKEVASKKYKKGEYEIIINLTRHLEEYLQDTYVFSLTSEPSNAHLISNYGNHIIELREDFPMFLVNTGCHSIPCGTAFSNHYFNDLYEHVEGYVIYNHGAQRQLANLAIEAILSITSSKMHIVDVFHIRKIIIMCIILFKQNAYEPEHEYRVALIRKSSEPHKFNMTRILNNNYVNYIRAIIPGLHQKYIKKITTSN